LHISFGFPAIVYTAPGRQCSIAL